jgi:hypothetical protein
MRHKEEGTDSQMEYLISSGGLETVYQGPTERDSRLINLELKLTEHARLKQLTPDQYAYAVALGNLY